MMTLLRHGACTYSAGIVETALKLLFGNDDERTFDLLRSRVRPFDSSIAIRWGASVSALRECHRHGYTTVRRFVVLPSRGNPKWLLPYDDRQAAMNALRAYTPYSRPLLRSAAKAFGLLAWPLLGNNVVSVATRQRSYFEIMAGEVAGQGAPSAAISFGAPGLFRKLSVRWMHASGSPLCHLKLPLTSEANDRVLHEATVLDTLWRHSALRPHIPRVVHSGSVNGVHFLVESPIEGKAGSVHFGPSHEALMRLLQQYQPTGRATYSVIERVAKRFRPNMSRMQGRWKTLGSDALRMAMQEFGDGSIACGLGHGDFTPWNTRQQLDRLSAFDWEAAELDVPWQWDKFHFITQSRSLLSSGCGLHAVTAQDHASYLLYLVDSATKLAIEGTRSNGVEYREAELARQLQIGRQRFSKVNGRSINNHSDGILPVTRNPQESRDRWQATYKAS